MKSLSFRWQLILFILLTCGVTLALAFAGFYLYDSQQFNAEVESRLAKTRSLMLDNLGPLLDQNPHATDIQLNLLGVDAQIAAAAVYSSDGKILTRYVRAGQTEVIPPLPRVSKLLDVSRGVVWEPILGPTNRPLGTLYLKAEQSEADRDRLSNLLRGSAIVFVVAALLAGAMAWRFQGRITEPITELARVSTTVQRERNYNERVQTTASGEIGELIDSFNAMLDTIQSNTSELERARVAAEDAHEKIIQAHDQLEEANRTLEARVDDRTRLLAKAVKDAEEASKAKSSFLAKMSHELRTPLNAIIGYSEIMKEDAEDDGDTRRAEDLDKVLNAARHLLGLINDVLDISKIEAGKMELYVETFDLTKLINEVIATASPLVSKKGNTLAIDCPADIGAMHADATKLRQMLLNLLSNASKFTEKGTVTLKAVRVIEEERDQPVGEVVGNLTERQLAAGTRRVLDPQVITEEPAEPAQRLDQQEIDREPDRTTPVRVAAEYLGHRLAGLVPDAELGATQLHRERLGQMRLGERAQPVRGEELLLVEHAYQNPRQPLPADHGEQPLLLPTLDPARADHLGVLRLVREEPAQPGGQLGQPGQRE